MFHLPSKNAALALTIIFAVLTVIVVATNLPSICTTTFLGCAVLYGLVWFFKFDRDRQLVQRGREPASRPTLPAAPAKSSPDSSSLELPDFE